VERLARNTLLSQIGNDSIMNGIVFVLLNVFFVNFVKCHLAHFGFVLLPKTVICVVKQDGVRYRG